MTSVPFTLNFEDGNYTSLLLEPNGTKAYLGSSKGCVEVWDLSEQRKLVELRYLKINEFGEQVPIEEPVVSLSAPNDFDVVYAFMGQAAYCIDVDLNVIIHQIPIAETVICGSVSPILGEVAILSKSGYLSRWSPKFIERMGSIEFPFEIARGYITHDFDESRVILVLDSKFILLTNLEGERYTVELDYKPADDLLHSNWFDKNDIYQIYINKNGEVIVDSSTSKTHVINETSILVNGIYSAAQNLRTAISLMDTGEDVRTYMKDLRLDRQSKDRYLAEVELLGKEMHYEGTLSDDSKTLDFAFREYHLEDIPSQAQALSVIDQISKRHDIKSSFAMLAWKLDGGYHLIENARYYEFEAYHRRNKINRYLTISFLVSFILLISSSQIIFHGMTQIFFLIIVLIQVLILNLWKQINTVPIIPSIEEYRAARLVNWLIIGLSIYFFIITTHSQLIERLIDKLPLR